MPIAVKQCSFNVFFFSREPTAIVLLDDKLQRIISEMKARGASPPLIATASIRRDVDFPLVYIAMIIVIIKR